MDFNVVGSGCRAGLPVVVRPSRDLNVAVSLEILTWGIIWTVWSPKLVPEQPRRDSPTNEQDPGIPPEEIGNGRLQPAGELTRGKNLSRTFSPRLYLVGESVLFQVGPVLRVAESSTSVPEEVLTDKTSGGWQSRIHLHTIS